MKLKTLFCVFFAIAFLSGCSSPPQLPKPRGETYLINQPLQNSAGSEK